MKLVWKYKKLIQPYKININIYRKYKFNKNELINQLIDNNKYSILKYANALFPTIIISCSRDKRIQLWNCDNGQCIQTLNGHDQGVYCISVS